MIRKFSEVMYKTDHLLLLQIFTLLNSFSRENYLVGGCVRDLLLGKQPNDYDIVTTTPISQIEKLFTENGWGVDTCGSVFNVLVISRTIERRNYMYEIANPRKDGKYVDGRRPISVEGATIEEDAKRRDFTINALYLNPYTHEILDPTNLGLTDISERVLRFVGKPAERIKEDYLRVFRFYRFLSQLNHHWFVPDKRSLKACRTFFNEAVEKTTPERIRLEIEKMIQ